MPSFFSPSPYNRQNIVEIVNFFPTTGQSPDFVVY